MTDGAPELDPNEVDIARFYPYARTKTTFGPGPRRAFPRLTGSSIPMSSGNHRGTTA